MSDDIEIMEAEYRSYEQVRLSGVTNMFDVKVVGLLTGLNREKIKKIMLSYGELSDKWGRGDSANAYEKPYNRRKRR